MSHHGEAAAGELTLDARWSGLRCVIPSNIVRLAVHPIRRGYLLSFVGLWSSGVGEMWSR
jgi:hypothetical protein